MLVLVRAEMPPAAFAFFVDEASKEAWQAGSVHVALEVCRFLQGRAVRRLAFAEFRCEVGRDLETSKHDKQ